MTAKDIISKALILLGYNDEYGSSSESRFQAASINAVNTVLADLLHCLGRTDYGDISGISVQIDLPNRILYDVFPYGVAAYIAESIGDSDKQQYFATLYNTKRRTVNYSDTVEDIFPTPEGV